MKSYTCQLKFQSSIPTPTELFFQQNVFLWWSIVRNGTWFSVGRCVRYPLGRLSVGVKKILRKEIFHVDWHRKIKTIVVARCCWRCWREKRFAGHFAAEFSIWTETFFARQNVGPEREIVNKELFRLSAVRHWFSLWTRCNWWLRPTIYWLSNHCFDFWVNVLWEKVEITF